MKHKGYVFLLVFGITGIYRQSFAQTDALQVKIGGKLLKHGLDSLDQGPGLRGLESLWYRTGDGRYFKAIQLAIENLVNKDGNIVFNQADPYYTDLVGRNLLLVYKVTNQERYYKMATNLLQNLKSFSPGFAAGYGALFHEPDLFNDATRQFVAHSKTGREMRSGMYGLALADALDYFPVVHPGRDTLLTLFRQYAEAAQKTQQAQTGLWSYNIAGEAAGNKEPDALTSCLYVYTLAKGVRSGWLPASFRAVAKKGYAGILKKYVSEEGGFHSNIKMASLGEGAFLLAADEIALMPTLALGKGRTVMLDYYFNNEHKKDITGQSIRYHYTWEDQSNSGFFLFGEVFRQFGMHTDSLPFSPDADNLKKASIYIIVDPDDDRESPSPNYMASEKAQKIYDWVNAGGVLVLMSNDSANAEFANFNQLPERFGIHFNWDCIHKVTGNKYEMGASVMNGQEGIFKTTKKVYIKELSTLKLSPPANPAFTEGKDVIVAVAKVGKGTVFAVGDPWFYNEYFDGRKLPAEYDNFNAAKDLVRWLIEQIPPAGN